MRLCLLVISPFFFIGTHILAMEQISVGFARSSSSASAGSRVITKDVSYDNFSDGQLDPETQAEINRLLMPVMEKINQELKDIDMSTPESRKKIEEIHQREMSKISGSISSLARKSKLARYRMIMQMSDPEWKAVEPLISRVCLLRTQNQLFIAQPTENLAFIDSIHQSALDGIDPAVLEPEVERWRRAQAKLKTLTASGANAITLELRTVIGEMRTLRRDMQIKMDKAQEDLRSVLTVAQEAILIRYRLIE